MRTILFLFAVLIFGLASCGGSDTPPISVTNVTLTPATLQLAVGQNATLTAIIMPSDAHNQQKTWESSDSDIASVNNGQVTANAPGTATITVKTAEGNFTATSEVTVTPAPILVTGITIIGRNPIRLAVGATDRFLFSITPWDATNHTVTWSSSHPNIATVDVANGTITALTTGTTTITVSTQCGSRTATGTVTVEGTINISSSIDGVVIDGIRWATRNVDMPGTFAPHPESAGRFFQWGTLNGATHHWAATGTVTGWNSNSPDRVAWTAANDPCPTGWRVPTQAELQSLNNAGAGWITHNSVNGRIFGSGTNTIFLPAAGIRSNSNGALSDVGTGGLYWSSTALGTTAAASLSIVSTNSSVFTSRNRASGFSVRCVAD